MWTRRVSPHVLWLVLIVSLCFNAGVGATFGVRGYKRLMGPCEGPDRPGRGMHGRLLDDLHLTPEQQNLLDESRRAMSVDLHEIRQAMHRENAVLAELLAAPVPDRTAIDAQLVTVGALRDRMQAHVVDHFLDVKEQVLRTDQQEIFNETIRRVFSRGGPNGPGFRSGRGLHDRRGPRGRRPLIEQQNRDSVNKPNEPEEN